MKSALLTILLTMCNLAAVRAATFAPGTGGLGPSQPLGMTGVAVWSQPPNLNGYVGSSEVISSGGFESQIVNDFVLAGQTGQKVALTRVKWWGGYFNTQPGYPHVTGFTIRFYSNASCLPASLLAQYSIPFQANESFVYQQGGTSLYEYHVDVRWELPANTPIWFSVQASDHPFPPQWGWLAAASVQGCESVFKSAYLGYPAWTVAHTVFGQAYDASMVLESDPDPVADWREMMRDNHANVKTTMSLADEYFVQNDSLVGSEDLWMGYARYSAFWAPRMGADGSYQQPNEALYDYLNSDAAHPPVAQVQASWQELGPFTNPGLRGGYITGKGALFSLWVDPGMQSIYAGSGSSGLWKTTDGGGHWAPRVGNMTSNTGVGDILKTPDGRLFWTSLNIRYVEYGYGLLVSTDDGTTWNQTGLSYTPGTGWPEFARKLLLPDQNTPLLMYAMTASKIYQTTDGGATFTQGSNPNPAPVFSVPGADFQNIYVKPGVGGKDHVYVAGKQLWYTWTATTTSNDTNWLNLTPSLVAPTSPAITTADVTGIMVGLRTNDPNTIWAAVAAQNGNTYILTAPSPGLTGWTQVSNSAPAAYGGFAISPASSAVMYAGNYVMYKSVNGGVSWTAISHGYAPFDATYVHADVRGLKVFGGTNDILFVVHDGGISKSTNAGATWLDLNGYGLNISEFYGIGGVEGSAHDKVIGGLQDLSTMIYDSGSWFDTSYGDGGRGMIDPSDPTRMYGSITCLPSRTTNDGNTWYYINPAGTAAFANAPPPLAMHPSSSNIIWTGLRKLWRSTNYGTNWTMSGGGTSEPAMNQSIQALDVNFSDPDVVYFSECCPVYPPQNDPNDYVKICRSNDGGLNWQAISAQPVGADWQEISGIASDPKDPNSIWVSFRGFWAIGTQAIYKVMHYSPVAGWTDETANLPNMPVNCIAYEKGSNDGIYIGTDVGVYYRDATMTQWQPFKNQMPDVIVTDLKPNYTTDKIRAATHGRGLWESYMADAGVRVNGTDGYLRDCPADTGIEPDASCALLYLSSDIWVQNTRDTQFNSAPDRFLKEHVHENPEYAVIPANRPWVYAKVRNDGTVPLTGSIQLYWTQAATGSIWPTSFTNGTTGNIVGGTGTPPIQITNLLPGAVWTVERQWLDIPDFNNNIFNGDDHFCLIARFTSAQDPVNGEQQNVAVWQNVVNSNNIAWKNLTLVNNVANKTAQTPQLVNIQNCTNTNAQLKLVVTVPQEQEADSYFGYGRMWVSMEPTLYGRWYNAGHQGSGIEILPDSTILVAGPGATISGIPMGPLQAGALATRWELNDPDQFPANRTFDVNITQYTGTAAVPDGGEGYQILAGRLDPASAPDTSGLEGSAVTLLENAPNPFQSHTSLRFTLPHDAEVTLQVFDVGGRVVATLIDKIQYRAGRHDVDFDSHALSSGIYFARLAVTTDGGKSVLKRRILSIR